MRGEYALSALLDCPWAITTNVMKTMLGVAVEEKAVLEAAFAQEEDYTANRVKRQGRTAVLNIEGPIFEKASLFHKVSGGTSVSLFKRDFQAALDDPLTEAILLDVNSAGGEAAGVSEMAQHIFEARGRKPVWAYIGSRAYSGGYWLASAAERIVMYKTAWAGSIGVIATVTDSRKRKERDGYTEHDFVSSQSPLKRMDPATDAGAQQLQQMVDEMAAHFIADVAAFRAVTAEHVAERFGRGGVLAAERAVAAGMADETGTFDGTLARLNGEGRTDGKALFLPAAAVAAAAPAEDTAEKEESKPMAEDKQPDTEQVRAAAEAAASARIEAILYCEEANGREALARHIAFKHRNMGAEEARGFLAAAERKQPEPAPEAKAEDQFAAHMRTLMNPQVGVGGDEPDDIADEVRRVTGYLPAAQRRAS
jgi:capsid assembly protease